MDAINTSDYKEIYLETAKEYLDKLSKSYGNLVKDPSDKEALNNLHISSHSLKSQSQVMNYTDLAKTTSRIEKIARSHLDLGEKLSQMEISVLKEDISKVSVLINNLEK